MMLSSEHSYCFSFSMIEKVERQAAIYRISLEYLMLQNKETLIPALSMFSTNYGYNINMKLNRS